MAFKDILEEWLRANNIGDIAIEVADLGVNMSMTRQASDACGKASMDMRSLSYQNRNPTRPDMADGSWCSITRGNSHLCHSLKS